MSLPDSSLIIRTERLQKFYGEGAGTVHALKDVEIEVFRGEFVSIMGQSGSGKSTLLHILGCLHRPTGGSYWLDGARVDESLTDRELSTIRNRKVGIVFQQYNLLPSQDLLRNTCLPLIYAGVDKAGREERARRTLEALGLGDRIWHHPAEVSGGQAQRAAIARAIVGRPAVLLADEPTGNLDSKSGEEVMGLFQVLNRAGRTIVQVTHDKEKAEYGDRIIHISDGRIAGEEKVAEPKRAPTMEADLSFLGDDDAAL